MILSLEDMEAAVGAFEWGGETKPRFVSMAAHSPVWERANGCATIESSFLCGHTEEEMPRCTEQLSITIIFLIIVYKHFNT